MKLSAIVAASTNNVIGKNNQLLWSLPNDMKFFKKTTWGMPVIMGRKTFESIGKPLTGRLNIVITRNSVETKWYTKYRDVVVVHTLEDAILATNMCDEAFIIGGGEIFRAAMPIIDRIYLTRVDVELDGDTLFPDIGFNEWIMKTEETFPVDAKHAYSYHFQVWERTTP